MSYQTTIFCLVFFSLQSGELSFISDHTGCYTGVLYLGGAGGPTDGAQDSVGQVCPSSSIQRLTPFQSHWGVVDLTHDGARSRGGAWGGSEVTEVTEVLSLDSQADQSRSKEHENFYFCQRTSCKKPPKINELWCSLPSFLKEKKDYYEIITNSLFLCLQPTDWWRSW